MSGLQKLIVFRMRLEGMTYDAIAKKTGNSEFTLRRYFAQKGKWYQEYKTWSSTEITNIRDELRTALISQSLGAMKTIENMLHSDNPSIVLRAAQDILDRAGFQKSDDNKLNSPVENIAERIMRRYETCHP